MGLLSAQTPLVGPRFSVTRPSAQRIRSFVGEQRELELTYAPVGATLPADGDIAASYPAFNVDRRRVNLGIGHDVYEKARAAVRNWQMFDLPWVELCWPNTRISPGSQVALLAHLRQPMTRGWVMVCARIVYVVDETGDIDRFGFAYGTLPGHILAGEELFLVEHDRATGMVSFEICAVSKPNQVLAWLGYPVIRSLQTRFRVQSTAAMQRLAGS